VKSVDTASPRATFQGFLDGVNRAYLLVTEANFALQAAPPRMSREKARETEILANNLLQHASMTLDLSQVPEALRQEVRIETVLQLKEIFD
jgi:hypothetical protein